MRFKRPLTPCPASPRPAHHHICTPPAHSTIEDLMDLDMGDLYQKIIESDEKARLYGYIPLMASSSPYQIGALNAESYCERVLRCAGHILNEGNTVLGDDKLEKLVILRMNRAFMVHMRKHYRYKVTDALTRQFGVSVVQDDA